MDDSCWTITIRIPKPKRRWFRYSLRVLFGFVLIAGIIAGVTGLYVRQRLEEREYFAATYFVGDVLGQRVQTGTNGPAYAALIQEIRDSVAPNTWESVGGLGTIRQFAGNSSLVVSQKKAVHEGLADFLSAKRKRSPFLSQPTKRNSPTD